MTEGKPVLPMYANVVVIQTNAMMILTIHTLRQLSVTNVMVSLTNAIVILPYVMVSLTNHTTPGSETTTFLHTDSQ